MKEKVQSWVKRLFKKENALKSTSGIIPVITTSYSQPHVLQFRMLEERLTHGQMVEADLPAVRIEKGYDKSIIYFCPLGYLWVGKTVKKGDGQAIPGEVTTVDLQIPEDKPSGLYALRNVRLFSNGTMQVIGTKKTKWELIGQ